jgi:cell division protein FtsB
VAASRRAGRGGHDTDSWVAARRASPAKQADARRGGSAPSSGPARPERNPGRAARRAGAAADTPFLGLSTGRALILAMVTCALALTLAVPLRTYFGQNAEAARVAALHQQLLTDIARLKGKRSQQQDPAYIRAQARTRLRLVEPGQTPYIVQLPGEYEASLPPAPAPPKPTGPWYSQLWHSVSTPLPTPAPPPVVLPPAPAPAPGDPEAPPGQVK